MTPFVAERRALRFSAISASLFAFTGLTLGLTSGSITILFDSGYSLLSLVLASLSLFALQQARKPADEHYPFGRLTVEPLAVLLKGVVIVMVCIVSLVSALWSLLDGGRLVTLDLALMFGVVNVTGCLLTWWWLARYAGVARSSLLTAELRQWQMDTWLSAAVMLGFGLTWLLTQSPWASYARFADPVMVLIIAGYFLPMPVRMVKGALRELMFGGSCSSVRRGVVEDVADFDVTVDDVRLAQVGSFLVVDIQLDKQQFDDAQEIVESIEKRCKRLNLRPITSLTLVAGCASSTIAPSYTTDNPDVMRMGGERPGNRGASVESAGSFCLETAERWNEHGRTPDGQTLWAKDTLRKVVPCKQ